MSPASHINRIAILLNGNELATILHGLRMIQENANGPADCMAACCDHFDGWDELNDTEIDELCERLNPLDTEPAAHAATEPLGLTMANAISEAIFGIKRPPEIKVSPAEVLALSLAKANEQVSGFDYEHQAWVKDGRYVACGHDGTEHHCNCYGRLHKGELVSPELARDLEAR